jgi:hypothetical protein
MLRDYKNLACGVHLKIDDNTFYISLHLMYNCYTKNHHIL